MVDLAVRCTTTMQVKQVISTDAFFHNNQAGGGGAIYCSYRLRLYNSILVNNEATSGGGAVYSSNGNYFNWSMQNNTIAHNRASVGGGLYATNGIGFASQYLLPLKTIFYNNESTNTGVNNDFYLQVQSDHTIRFDGCSLGGDLTNCNQGSSTVSEMESILSTNPIFINPSAGIGVTFDGFTGRNWDVDQCSSPCVDPSLDWTSPSSVDYDGDPRHTNATVDIGAYESYGFLSQPQDIEICDGDSSIFSSDYSIPEST